MPSATNLPSRCECVGLSGAFTSTDVPGSTHYVEEREVTRFQVASGVTIIASSRRGVVSDEGRMVPFRKTSVRARR
jgi:hypothetical protein